MVKQSDPEESLNGIFYDHLQHKVKIYRFVEILNGNFQMNIKQSLNDQNSARINSLFIVENQSFCLLSADWSCLQPEGRTLEGSTIFHWNVFNLKPKENFCSAFLYGIPCLGYDSISKSMKFFRPQVVGKT